MNDNAIGERINKLLSDKKETQKELGEKIGLSQSAISKIIRNVSDLTISNLLAIAEHFNVSPEYILTGSDNEPLLSLLNNYISLYYSTLNLGEAQ